MKKHSTFALTSLQAAVPGNHLNFVVIVSTPNNLWQCLSSELAEVGTSLPVEMGWSQEKLSQEEWKKQHGAELIEKKTGEAAIV